MASQSRRICELDLKMNENERSDTYNLPGVRGFQRGNPGRPKNSRNAFAAETYKKVIALEGDAIETLKRNLAAGSLDAAKFVLERVIGRNRSVVLESISPEDVAQALIDGTISTAEAKESRQQ